MSPVQQGFNVPNAQLGVAREVQSLGVLDAEKARTYRIFTVALPVVDLIQNTFTRVAPVVKATGDTLTVLEINGPHEVGIAVNIGNDYLPVDVGSVITRDITEVSVKVFSFTPPLGVVVGTPSTVNTTALTRVTFAVSYGPLLTFPSRLHAGFRACFPMATGIAATTGTRIMDVLNGPENNVPINILKYGGTLRLKNRSGNDMFLYFGVGGDFNGTPGGIAPGTPGASWVISAGEILEIPAMEQLSQRTIVDGRAGLTLCLAGSLAQASFSVMLSRWGDASDIDSNTGGNFSFRTSRQYGAP